MLAKGADVVPIPYLEENAAAAAIKLTPDEVAKLEAAVPHHEVAGDRYAAANMKTIDR